MMDVELVTPRDIKKGTSQCEDAEVDVDQALEKEVDVDQALEKEVDVDQALEKGGFGRFQYLTFILLNFIHITFGHQVVLAYFIANDPAWTCARNNTSDFCAENYGTEFGSDSKLFSARCDLAREEWVYTTQKLYSIVTEFDLVCDKAPVAALISSIVYIGAAVGFFISGFAADQLGRKYVLLISLCLVTVSGFSCSYVTSIWQLILTRLFIGAGYNSSYGISYVYISETVPPSQRTPVAVGYCIGFVLTQLLVDLLSYYVRVWRSVVLYTSLPTIVGIVLLFFVPESPRWLLVNGKKSLAETTLNKIAKWNGKSDVSFKLKSPIITEERYTYKDLFASRQLAKLTLSLAILWLTTALSYYTIAFESSSLGGDMYSSFAFSALAEIPSKFLALYTCDHLGRKKTTLISIFLSVSFASSTMLIPKTFVYRYITNIVVMMLARFFADINIQGIYLWSFETFPTILRMQGIGMCILFERGGGSFGAPFLTSVLQPINAYLPFIILDVCMLSAVTFAYFVVDETKDRATKECYDDFFDTPEKDEGEGEKGESGETVSGIENEIYEVDSIQLN